MIRYHLKFYNIRFKGWLIIAASCGRGDIITSFFSQSFNLVVKGAGIDVMFCTPLVVTKTAAAAFHDKLILFVCCASLRFHTGNLHSYSKTLAFIVSSADTVVKCWHLSSIIMANFVMILNPP